MIDTSTFFDLMFNNTKANAMLIMTVDGIIEKVNEAFTSAFGYTTEDIHSKHNRILFIEKDRLTRKPEIEINTTLRMGSSSDENYLVHKNGTPIWVTGESILIDYGTGSCIVKIVHNIHAQKQLERYLLSSSELLDSLFESVQQSGLLLLDTQMKTIKGNGTFRRIFNIDQPIGEGLRMQQLGHPFWCSDEIKNDVRNAIVNGHVIDQNYIVEGEEHKPKRLHITSKLIIGEETLEKKLLLMLKEE